MLFRDNHIKREAVLMAVYPLIIFLMLVIAIVVFTVKQYLSVDSCLDAGGAYDYELKECKFNNHEQESNT